MSIFRLLSLATLVSLCGFASASTAKAGEYASFVIHNLTTATIHYQVKWGDGEWKSYCVGSGEKMYHAYPMSDNGTAPAPRAGAPKSPRKPPVFSGNCTHRL